MYEGAKRLAIKIIIQAIDWKELMSTNYYYKYENKVNRMKDINKTNIEWANSIAFDVFCEAVDIDKEKIRKKIIQSNTVDYKKTPL